MARKERSPNIFRVGDHRACAESPWICKEVKHRTQTPQGAQTTLVTLFEKFRKLVKHRGVTQPARPFEVEVEAPVEKRVGLIQG